MPKVQRVLISLRIELDTGLLEKDFKTVQELANYMKENPEVAKLVNYVPKK